MQAIDACIFLASGGGSSGGGLAVVAECFVGMRCIGCGCSAPFTDCFITGSVFCIAQSEPDIMNLRYFIWIIIALSFTACTGVKNQQGLHSSPGLQ